jgi:hypothetical protein
VGSLVGHPHGGEVPHLLQTGELPVNPS